MMSLGFSVRIVEMTKMNTDSRGPDPYLSAESAFIPFYPPASKGHDMAENRPEDQPPPLRSVHTSNFPELLDQLGISLLVTTYQAGKVVFLRADRGVLNTHFRDLPAPMGVALQGNRLAIGGP